MRRVVFSSEYSSVLDETYNCTGCTNKKCAVLGVITSDLWANSTMLKGELNKENNVFKDALGVC